MKRLGSAFWCSLGLAALAFAPVGCTDDTPVTPYDAGVVTVGFVPRPLTLPYVDLTYATVRIDRLQVIGNVPPPPPNQTSPPPQNLPPPKHGIDLDALSAGLNTNVDGLPQGLYSRVRFLLGGVSLDGTWRGTPFHADVAPFGAMVDIRASTPQELGQGQDVAFEISVDPNFWFPPGVFDGAQLDGRGVIVSDDVNNPQVGATIVQAMTWSFLLP